MSSKTSSDKKNGKHSRQKESDNKRSLTVRLNLSMGQQIYLTSLIKAYTSIAKKLHEEARAKFMELTNGEIKNIKELKDIKKKFYSWFNEYFKTQRKWITDSLGSNISDQLFQFLMAQYKNFFANYENFFEHKVDGRPSFPSLPELFQIRDRGVEVDFDKMNGKPRPF